MAPARHDGASAAGSRTRKAAWEEFCKNQELKKAYRISPAEMTALGKLKFLGNVCSPRDFIFMLDIIRTSKRLKESAETE